MELIIAILAVLGVIALGFFLLLVYSGFFYTYSIRCTIPASVPKRFAYELHIGPYEKIGPVFCKLSDLVPTKPLFSVYYDNPETVCPYIITTISRFLAKDFSISVQDFKEL